VSKGDLISNTEVQWPIREEQKAVFKEASVHYGLNLGRMLLSGKCELLWQLGDDIKTGDSIQQPAQTTKATKKNKMKTQCKTVNYKSNCAKKSLALYHCTNDGRAVATLQNQKRLRRCSCLNPTSAGETKIHPW